MPALYEMGVLFPLREPLKAKIFKKEVSKIVLVRRSRFNRKRDQYMLSMLHAGYPYICAHHCCSETLSLTIDHIIPLSKGGSDDLNNFQFLCQKHNSEKGASMPTKK